MFPPGLPVHIRLSPKMQQKFSAFFESFGYSSSTSSSSIAPSVVVDNLQTLIEQENEEMQTTGT